MEREIEEERPYNQLQDITRQQKASGTQLDRWLFALMLLASCGHRAGFTPSLCWLSVVVMLALSRYYAGFSSSSCWRYNVIKPLWGFPTPNTRASTTVF
ncbi:MAG: hypothetical protein P8183_08000 [Anaerolineae bacterium]